MKRTTQPAGVRDRAPEEPRPATQGQGDARERTLDKTLEDSFPASDPPSTLPDPKVDAFAA